MAIIFPNPATQVPVNTFSPTSTPNATTNGLTYTYDVALGVWISTSSGGGGGVGSVTVTAPITDTGTATAPVIGISAATNAAPGSVQLATSAEAAAGTNATKALTPSDAVPKDASGMTGAALIPGGDDTERAAITTPTAGMLRYNDQGGIPVAMEYYDGVAWTRLSTGGGGAGIWQVFVPTGTSGDLVLDVASGNGVYVALIYNAGFYTMTSSDGGYTWGNRSQRGTNTSTTPQSSRIIYEGTQFFVAAAQPSFVYTYVSTDGITWTPNASAGFVPNYPSAASIRAAAGGGAYVVGGFYQNASERYYYSTDGLNWNLSASVGPAGGPLGVQWAGGTNFISVNGDGTIRLSTDGGSTWVLQAGTISTGSSQEYLGSVWDGTNTIWYKSDSFGGGRGIFTTATGATVTQRYNTNAVSGYAVSGSKAFGTDIGTNTVLISSSSYATYLGYVEGTYAVPQASNGTTLVGIASGAGPGFYVGLVP